MRLLKIFFLPGLFFLLYTPSFCQLGFNFDIKKPKPFEERVLRSEKSDKTKFNVPRRFIQNSFTHYNYFFNANNKLNEVLERAKLSHQDDYSQLITFYNYTLDEVSRFTNELDSLVNKAQTAIVLHDLRNDWTDNMYLIWGAAYYLRKDLDSAFLTFQFLNYAFAPKEKDGYYRYIGSKADGNTPTTISTKEKNSLPKRLLSEPPSRNDAFVWQVRTYLAMERYAEASSLIAQLRNDPVFPQRLRNDLEEVQALYFYQQGMWDSCATHLIPALSNAGNKKERTRWEYLIAQLLENSKRFAEAQTYYSKVIGHTTDPVLEIYARLGSIRVNKDGGEGYIDRNVAELIKMGRKDRYVDYRDIIFYMAAQMEMDRNNPDAAEKMLLKSLSYNYGNLAQRNKAFLQLAEIAFAKRNYRQSYSFYDSVQMSDPALSDPELIVARKDILGKISFHLETIDRQDSMQRLAAMPEEQRKDFVKKLVRKLRKTQGLKDEDFRSKEGLSSSPQDKSQPDLFTTSSAKGDWYFYNQSLRTRGAGDFKSRWGNRPNVDNWRRAGAVAGAGRQDKNNSNNSTGASNQPGGPLELTFDALYANIPLSADKLKVSNDSVRQALFELTNLYVEGLEDCAACIETSDTLVKRFPDFDKMDQVLFHLYYCSKKMNETEKAEQIKKLMAEKYGSSNYTAIATTGKNPSVLKAEPQPTREYEKIYDLFIEGSFEEALDRKKTADSLYGKNYWNPQLMYIEAVYHAKQREDSAARNILSQLIALYPGAPLKGKAETLLNVLGRRAAIENELTNLVIERPAQDNTARKTEEIAKPEPVMPDDKAPVLKKDSSAVVKTDTERKPKAPGTTITKKSATDSVAIKVAPPPMARYEYDPNAKHYVMIVLNKVDNVFRNEAKNAFTIFNREKYYDKVFDYSTLDIDAENKLLLIGGFENAEAAITYIQQAKPVATTRIVPWLKPEKYSFSIISEPNLEILKVRPLLTDYRAFADKYWQGKF